MKSSVGKMHITAVNYVNENLNNPNVIIKYGDLQFRDVINNVLFINPKNIYTLLKYYNGKTSLKMYFYIKIFKII